MEIPLQDIVNKAVKEPREEKAIVSWHASRLGSCLRGMYLERIGEKPDTEFDDRQLRVFHCGRVFENWLVDLISKQKDYKVETQVRVEDKELNVSGYTDLVLSNGEGKKVYEIKSKHSAGFKYTPQEQHRQQLWIYLKVLGISEGNLVYLSKDDLRIAEYPVFLSDKKLEKEVLSQLELLNKAFKNKTPEILPLPEEGSFQEKFCRFHSKCIKL